MNAVYILRGVSGSGKSHVAKKLGGKVVSADHFFMMNGVYMFDPALLSAAHNSCLREFLNQVHNNWQDDIVVDNTNTTVEEIAPYYCVAQACGWTPTIVNVPCDWKVAAARNSHGVPEHVVKAQFDRLATTVLPARWLQTIHVPESE